MQPTSSFSNAPSSLPSIQSTTHQCDYLSTQSGIESPDPHPALSEESNDEGDDDIADPISSAPPSVSLESLDLGPHPEIDDDNDDNNDVSPEPEEVVTREELPDYLDPCLVPFLNQLSGYRPSIDESDNIMVDKEHEELFETVAKHCPKLERIIIGSYPVMLRGLEQIGRHCHNLTCFHSQQGMSNDMLALLLIVNAQTSHNRFWLKW